MISQKYGILLAIIAVIVIAGTAYAMSQKLENYTWRYKITVKVETPEGIKTGSSVREVTNQDNTLFGEKLPEVGSRISNVKGEAVVIDLGKRGVIFALIDHGSYGELYSAFSVSNPSNSTADFNKLKLGMIAPLPRANWPMFVTFQNIADPKSVVLVRGWRFDAKEQKEFMVDDFEKIFGKGVVPKSITIEINDEPVTWTVVDGHLPRNFNEFKKEWRELPIELRRQIGKLVSFKQGE